MELTKKIKLVTLTLTIVVGSCSCTSLTRAIARRLICAIYARIHLKESPQSVRCLFHYNRYMYLQICDLYRFLSVHRPLDTLASSAQTLVASQSPWLEGWEGAKGTGAGAEEGGVASREEEAAAAAGPEGASWSRARKWGLPLPVVTTKKWKGFLMQVMACDKRCYEGVATNQLWIIIRVNLLNSTAQLTACYIVAHVVGLAYSCALVSATVLTATNYP